MKREQKETSSNTNELEETRNSHVAFGTPGAACRAPARARNARRGLPDLRAVPIRRAYAERE